jgi:hypothetical protein
MIRRLNPMMRRLNPMTRPLNPMIRRLTPMIRPLNPSIPLRVLETSTVDPSNLDSSEHAQSMIRALSEHVQGVYSAIS